MLWHTWVGEDKETIEGLLARFHALYPNITVINVSYPAAELSRQFADTVALGLGPDLMIGPHLWTLELVDAGLINAVDET